MTSLERLRGFWSKEAKTDESSQPPVARMLVESEHARDGAAALLKLLSTPDAELSSTRRCTPSPWPPPHNAAGDRDDASSADLECTRALLVDDDESLRSAMAAIVGETASPAGAALDDAVDGFRRTHAGLFEGSAEPRVAAGGQPWAWLLTAAPSMPPELMQAPARTIASVTALARRQLGYEAPATASAAAAEAAAADFRRGLDTFHMALVKQLPPRVLSSPVWREQTHAFAEERLFRSLGPALMLAYERKHSAASAALAARQSLLPRLQPAHLGAELGRGGAAPANAELPTSASSPYSEGVRLLRTLRLYRTPREKARVLLQMCEAVAREGQRELDMAATSRPSAPRRLLGAEELLPLVVYVLLQARLPQICAEIDFVGTFLPESQQCGKEGYAMTTVHCASRLALRDDFFGAVRERHGPVEGPCGAPTPS